MQYVLFRENTNHHEIYLKQINADGTVSSTLDVTEAKRFRSASDGYRFGAMHCPALDWWRVGTR